MEKFIESKWGDFNLKFDDSHASKYALFAKMLAWYEKMEAFDGESIMQSDEPQIEAGPFLAEIADEVFKFKVTYVEDE